MAVRFDNAADRYTVTVSQGAVTDYTFCCWMKLSVATATWWGVMGTDAGSSADSAYFEAPSAGTTVRPNFDNAGGITGAFSVTVGTWYFVAVTVSGTSVSWYYKAFGSPTLTLGSTQTAANAAQVMTNLRLGVWAGNTEPFNGCITGARYWLAALTQAELEAESQQLLHKRTAGILASYPLETATTADSSGNGRTLTAAGTPTTEAGPGIPLVAGTPVPVGTPTSASTTGASVAVTAPAGLAVGDYQLIIAALSGDEITPTSVTTPSGWALLKEPGNTNLATVLNKSDTGPFQTYVFTSSSDTASVTVSKVGATPMHLVRIAWRGGQGFNLNSLTVQPTQPAGTGQLQNTSFAIPSCTTTLRESMVVAVAHVDSGSAATTFTLPGWMERYDATVLTGRSVCIYDIVVATPGTPSGTLTLSRSDFINMIAIELTAAAVTREQTHYSYVPRNRAALW